MAETGNEATLLAMAVEQAEREAAEQEKAQAEIERSFQVAKAKDLIVAIGKTSAEADKLMQHLADCLQHRADLINELTRTRAAYSGVIKLLTRESTITSAMAAAGLGKFVEWFTGSARKPLAETVIRPDLIGGGGDDDS